ncbi:MAG: hypothetical protein JW934_19410 [Anaerolineae bacterium]|nr:hypothetical protein [Anaerolineae bacterium]
MPIKLRLHPGEDDDLIAFFEAVPPRRRAQAVLVALRSGGLTCAMSGEDVDEAALAGALENLLF